jgi:uncharacterized protein
MVDRIPDLFDPLEFAEKKRRIRASLPLAEMDRLRGSLTTSDGCAEVDLSFGKFGRLPSISGTISANLQLECQRCLESIDWPVEESVSIALVASIDEVELLPEQFEPLVVAAGELVAFVDIVQDELLLAIPVIPRHNNCQIPYLGPELTAEQHPFAALMNLKKTD